MPYLTYQIAAIDNNPSPGDTDATKEYDFQDLQGNPIRATEQIQVIQRRGVDYHGIRQTGKRGRPFTLRSIEYITWAGDLASTLEDAWDRVVLYEALKGASLGVKVTQRDQAFWPCDVIAVEPQTPPFEIAGAAGSLVSNPRVQLNCVWQLIQRQTT